MIKTLERITELQFPVVSCKKYDIMDSNKHELRFDDISLQNHGNLYNTFQLNIDELPETYETFPIPEALFLHMDNITSKMVLIDDNLNIFRLCKTIKVTIFTGTLEIREGRFTKVVEVPYYLPTFYKSGGIYPVIAEVDGLYFHLCWADKRFKNEEYI